MKQRPTTPWKAGALATLVGIGVMWGVTGFVTGSEFPPAAVADAVIRLTPGDVATFFIEALGHWAMRLLSFGVLAVIVMVGARMLTWTSTAAGARPIVAGLVMAALAGGLFLMPPVTSGDVASIVIALVGGLAYAGAAGALLPAARSTSAEQDGPDDPGRRRVLRLGTGGALALAATGGFAGWIARRFAGPNTDVELVQPVLSAEVPVRDAFPEIAGLTPEITAVRDHYVVDINFVQPSVDADGWQLRVFGEVAEPLTLDFNELQTRFEVVEQYSTLCCISNEVGGDLIGNSAWGGVRLRDVLEAARVNAEGTELVLRAADGYSDSFPVDLAMEDSVLLAVSQNGQPLTQEHGFPCRVRIPRLYGMENVKWLESIEVVRSDYSGYWQERGWKDTAQVRTQSRIDVAGEDGHAVVGRDTWIAGIAWAGARGIERVEVSTDNGNTWNDAILKEPLAEDSWRTWAYRWTPRAQGEAAVMSRATDGEGLTQTTDLAEPHPAGATGLHTVTVTIDP